MKKRSAFFNLRVFVTSILCSIGLFLALLGLGAKPNEVSSYGGPDINLITGAETSPKVTQSTSSIWGHGNTVVVVYADSSGMPASACGVSTSTDGGATFTRLPEKFNAGGVCFSESSVFYSVQPGKWYTSFLSGAAACGGSGVGQYESLDGISWTNSGCVASSNNIDLPTTWVNNNPASLFYGSQYAAFNDFNVGGGAVRATRSTDGGATWSSPTTVFASFRRAVKVTGSPGADGTVFIQTMDEGGGGLGGMHQNFIHRSTDGGATWSAPLAQGAAFLGPGRATCTGNTYFTCMYTTGATGGGSYWREMGGGQPGVGPSGVVHYAYAGRTTAPVDPGNIYYIRSTDGGVTWSSPLLLNTDGTTRAQWGASLSVNATGKVFVSWYDERNTVDDSLQRFGRSSTDNGATWLPDMAVSDVIFPKPLQPDSNFQAVYAGFYDHAAFSDDGNGDVAYHAWTDGRVAINGSAQQDVFFDRISGVPAPANLLFRDGPSIVSAGANGVLDPGEVVTVALGLVNEGGPGVICTTALMGTLQASGGVTGPSGPQNYGSICSGGGPAVFRNYTFTVDPALACGSTVTASLALVDGATNFPMITYPFSTGNVATTNIQNFDGVVAPALPAGWTTFSSGSGTAATTVTTFPDTAPNSVFTSEAATVGLSEVTSPTLAVTSAGTKLRFRNLYNTEANFDGKVMEISINGGAFADIITAGGSFVSGGYNSTMPSTFMNPLPNRAAWSGLSGGTAAAPTYITTVVTLPAAATGQNVQFKWRQGSDATVVPATNPGSRVDTITLFANICGSTAPTVNSAVSRKTHGAAGAFDVPLPLVPLAGAIGIEDRNGAIIGEHQMVITFANPVTISGAAMTAGNGTVASSSVAGAVVTVNLSGVTDAQRLAVTLSNVSSGANLGNIQVPMGILAGDTNGNGSVNAGDVGQTKAQSGAVVGAGNFRTDVNSNGSINAGDVGLVKARSGTTLPP
jgi:hypothetical protein